MYSRWENGSSVELRQTGGGGREENWMEYGRYMENPLSTKLHYNMTRCRENAKNSHCPSLT